MRAFLAVVLAGVASSILFLLFEPEEKGLSRKDIEEILEDNVLIFQQPNGV